MIGIIFLLFVVVLSVYMCLQQPVAATITGRGSKKARLKTRVKNLLTNPRSKSEAAAIKCLEKLTGKKFPSVYPYWLVWRGRNLELDGYNEALNLAIEFSGPLHTKWTPGTEDYKEYFERIVRDVVKRKLCAKHGVRLIVLDCSLSREHWEAYLMSRLYDYELSNVKTHNYIPEIIAEPYRNPQLEEEAGLQEAMDEAESLN